MLVYQSTFNMLELKKYKWTDYVIGWKSSGLFESKLLPLHGTFLANKECLGYKIWIEFNNTPLVIEQNNYTTNNVSN